MHDTVPFVDLAAQHASRRVCRVVVWGSRCRASSGSVTFTPAAVRVVAEAAIRKVVQSKDNPADLINVALDELVRQSCELPGYTTLDAMTASIEHEVYGGTDEGNRRDGSGRASSRDHTRGAA